MKINQDITNVNFERLLEWLSSDRDEAGVRFEQVRVGLTRFFRIKGCYDPETLADEVMNRVIRRIDTLDLSTGVSPTSVFHGFATNVFREYVRSDKNRIMQFLDKLEQPYVSPTSSSANPDIDCLNECVGNLNIRDRKLIVEYYGEDGQLKINARRQLAEHFELTVGALHTRVHRIRGILRPCLEKCIKVGNIVRK